ncbi:hypothetical protein BH09BAC6_BH09BAC6_33030 [soil metagenome]|jgi:nucleotide-binding universal stress UspA family protein
MKTIVVVSDRSPAAEHAAEFAFIIAQKMEANILLAYTVKATVLSNKKVLAGHGDDKHSNHPATFAAAGKAPSLSHQTNGFVPAIKEIDIAGLDAIKMAEIVIRDNIWMMVKGVPNAPAGAPDELTLNIHSVLNRVGCPLLLVPQNWRIKNLEYLIYMADLRYCRIQVVRYVAGVAKAFNACLSIAHLSAKGLTNIVDTYADKIFNEEICPKVNYDKLFLNNTKEKDLHKAVDVIINGMHNDLLIMVNHRYHFEEIIGMYIGPVLPAEMTIPVLIFPY